jgi:hypothetical protein
MLATAAVAASCFLTNPGTSHGRPALQARQPLSRRKQPSDLVTHCHVSRMPGDHATGSTKALSVKRRL